MIKHVKQLYILNRKRCKLQSSKNVLSTYSGGKHAAWKARSLPGRNLNTVKKR